MAYSQRFVWCNTITCPHSWESLSFISNFTEERNFQLPVHKLVLLTRNKTVTLPCSLSRFWDSFFGGDDVYTELWNTAGCLSAWDSLADGNFAVPADGEDAMPGMRELPSLLDLLTWTWVKWFDITEEELDQRKVHMCNKKWAEMCLMEETHVY